MGCWENLNSKTGEKPRSVGRNIGRLIGPVVELVVTEETDIRHEYAAIDVNSVKSIEMISAVCFRQITVGVVQIPLPTCSAGVVPGRSLRIQSKLRHDSCANIV